MVVKKIILNFLFLFGPSPISILIVTLFSANGAQEKKKKKKRQVEINKLGLKLNREVDPEQAN